MGSIEKFVNFTCPQNQLKPSCQNLLLPSSSYCSVIAFTDYNTTCRCDMCQAKLTNNNKNRLLLSVEDSGYVEIGAMSSFVLNDAFSTLAENGDLTSAAAFNEAIIVVLAFGFMWGCILALITVAETMHRVKQLSSKEFKLKRKKQAKIHPTASLVLDKLFIEKNQNKIHDMEMFEINDKDDIDKNEEENDSIPDNNHESVTVSDDFDTGNEFELQEESVVANINVNSTSSTSSNTEGKAPSDPHQSKLKSRQSIKRILNFDYSETGDGKEERVVKNWF